MRIGDFLQAFHFLRMDDAKPCRRKLPDAINTEDSCILKRGDEKGACGVGDMMGDPHDLPCQIATRELAQHGGNAFDPFVEELLPLFAAPITVDEKEVTADVLQ